MAMNAIFDKNERMVASTGGHSDNFTDPDLLRLTQEADARLIAAAPELYEALSEIMNGFFHKADVHVGWTTFIPFERFDRARAAIAKAKGTVPADAEANHRV